jgi:hypothetical protein
VLSYRLGWDPDLKYYSDGSESRWVFSPGDGSPEKTIVLKPDSAIHPAQRAPNRCLSNVEDWPEKIPAVDRAAGDFDEGAFFGDEAQWS